MHAIMERANKLREPHPHRPNMGMGAFAGMNDYEVVAYLAVLPGIAIYP